MKKIISIILILSMLICLVSCSQNEDEKELKYIFLFIGDGMSFNQVQLARDTIAAKTGNTKPAQLSFSDFDSVGILTNYDKSSFIPDSASSGTAISTGKKTESGKVAEGALGLNFTSLATQLKEKHNMKVGIITTANINHATPAVFYAHSQSRYNYYEIGTYLPKSNFDFFAGGQFLDADGGDENLIELAKKGGYTVLDSREDIRKIENKSKKYLLLDDDCDSSGMLSFMLDRENEAVSLSEYLEIGIDLLDNDNGFFIMCEGGRIDSAMHANDAATAVGEIEAFSDAINVALDFYKKHQNETLILVTGDHETGGLSLGNTKNKYQTHFEILGKQKLSYLAFENEYVASYKTNNTSIETILSDIEQLFGLDNMSEYEAERLKYAWQKTLDGNDTYTEQDRLDWGDRTPLTIEATHLVANRAGIGFSTVYHTASPVGLWAKGVGETLFAGSYDNADITKKITQLT